MKKLPDFKTNLKKPHLFTDCTSSPPPFLQTNLVDAARTIKVFSNDSQAFVKIFYFQFLKFCFETQETDYEGKVNKFIQLIEDTSQPVQWLKPRQDNGEKLQQKMSQSILLQFLDLLSEGKETVQSGLAKYPIIDKIMVTFFLNLIEKQLEVEVSKADLNSSRTFQFLCEYFQVNLIEFDDCFQFVDTQIYVYKENTENIYLIYIDEGKAMRNTIREDFEDDQVLRSRRESETERSQMIVFDQSHVVFDETLQNSSELLQKTKGRDKEKKSNFFSLDFKKTVLTAETQPSVRTNKENGINVTQEFTNTFILQHVLEPYRSNVKNMKTRARAERKSRQFFFR